MGWGICPVWLLAKVSFGMLEPARPGREQPGMGCFVSCGLFEEEDFRESPAREGLRSWLGQGVWRRLSVTQSWSCWFSPALRETGVSKCPVEPLVIPK